MQWKVDSYKLKNSPLLLKLPMKEKEIDLLGSEHAMLQVR